MRLDGIAKFGRYTLKCLCLNIQRLQGESNTNPWKALSKTAINGKETCKNMMGIIQEVRIL